MIKKSLIGLVLFLLAGIAIFFLILPPFVDQQKNRVTGAAKLVVEPAVQAFHKNLMIADLHADSLLWGRDLTKKSQRGMVDFPRMREGNLSLQVFSVVTKTPRGLNINRNKADSDNITLLAVALRWPIATYSSLLERALYQANELHLMAERSAGEFEIITDREKLDQFLQRRTHQPKVIAGLLSVEGAHALEGDLDNLDRLAEAGFRMFSASHFFDTEIGGSAHGWEKHGLTELGREWVRKMNASCLIIDLSHASKEVFSEVLTISSQPVIVSHTGVKGTCNNNRNLSDQQLLRLAENGGLAGIGAWAQATCGGSVYDLVRAIRYTVDLIGINHVALGSDFDGAVSLPFDAANIVQITQALRNEGFNDQEIKAIMGENAIRFFRRTLGYSDCYIS